MRGLSAIHGEKTVKALVSMTGTLLVGQVGRGETAEALAKALGAREVERKNISATFGGAGEGRGSRTLSFNRDELFIYKPSELGSRLGLDAARGGVVMALALEGDVFELFWPHAAMRRVRPGHEPAVWTYGLGLARDDPRPETGFETPAPWETEEGKAADGVFQWSAPHQPSDAFRIAGADEAEQPTADHIVSDPSEYDYLFNLDDAPPESRGGLSQQWPERVANASSFEAAAAVPGDPETDCAQAADISAPASFGPANDQSEAK